MNKQTFLAQLRKALRELKREERKRQLAYYDEMLSDMMENGMSEEEATEKTGDSAALAATILSETDPHNLRKTDIPGILLIVITGVLFAASGFRRIFFKLDSSGIAVIGGADGPTSIFVAGKISNPGTSLLMWAFLFLGITILYFLIRHFRKRRKDHIS